MLEGELFSLDLRRKRNVGGLCMVLQLDAWLFCSWTFHCLYVLMFVYLYVCVFVVSV